MKNNDSEKENKICPNCLVENTDSIEFCKKCGRPLGNFVNYDPVNRILSTGWMYRKSISNPSSPIVLFGMWVLFGIPALLMVPLLFQPKDIGIFLITILYIIISSVILYKTTKNYKINKKSLTNRSSRSNLRAKNTRKSSR